MTFSRVANTEWEHSQKPIWRHWMIGVKNELYKFGAFIAMCTEASLRGNECFMAEAGLTRHIDRGRTE